MDEDEAAATARADGYCECQECGHTLEWDHDTEGCHNAGCGCREAWSRDAKRALRRRYRLPATWAAHLHI